MKPIQQYQLASLMFDAQSTAEYCQMKTGRTVDECFEDFPDGVEWHSPAFFAIGAAMELFDYIEESGINPDEMQPLHEAVTEFDIHTLQSCLVMENGRCNYSTDLLRTMAMKENLHRGLVGLTKPTTQGGQL